MDRPLRNWWTFGEDRELDSRPLSYGLRYVDVFPQGGTRRHHCLGFRLSSTRTLIFLGVEGRGIVGMWVRVLRPEGHVCVGAHGICHCHGGVPSSGGVRFVLPSLSLSMQLISASTLLDIISFNSPTVCCCSQGVGTVVCWKRDRASKFMAVMFLSSMRLRSSSSCFLRSCSCLLAACASDASVRNRFKSPSYAATIYNTY